MVFRASTELASLHILIRSGRLFHFYRPDLQRVLAEHLGSEGVEPQFGFRVARLDCEDGRLWLEDESSITVDLIVCADGPFVVDACFE